MAVFKNRCVFSNIYFTFSFCSSKLCYFGNDFGYNNNDAPHSPTAFPAIVQLIATIFQIMLPPMQETDNKWATYQLLQQSLHAAFTCGSLAWMCTDFVDSVKYSGWLNINFSDLLLWTKQGMTGPQRHVMTVTWSHIIVAGVQVGASQNSRSVRRSSIESLGWLFCFG